MFFLHFLFAQKESGKENAPKNPTEGLCVAPPTALQGPKSFSSRIFGFFQRSLYMNQSM
jgi:hypothetical protein